MNKERSIHAGWRRDGSLVLALTPFELADNGIVYAGELFLPDFIKWESTNRNKVIKNRKRRK